MPCQNVLRFRQPIEHSRTVDVTRKPPKILFAIAHYYDSEGDGRYGSTSKSSEPRVTALARTISSLHQTFGPGQASLHLIGTAANAAADNQFADVSVVVCTVADKHLMNELPVSKRLYAHHIADCDPKFIGYECHQLLASAAAAGVDYVVFLEDDIVVQDPLFFTKLRWFNETFGEDSVLQPNRFEIRAKKFPFKAYVDGGMRQERTEPYQDLYDRAFLEGDVMGEPQSFVRPLNPHSGCFFLSRKQMLHWAAQPYFRDRSTDFIGPLESAATLGVMRTFRVYKPALANPGFLEVEHAGPRYLHMVDTVFVVDGELQKREGRITPIQIKL